MKESGFYACARANGKCAIPRSKIENCADCGHKIWVAPSAQNLALKVDLIKICAQCLVKRHKKKEKFHTQKLNSEQKMELRGVGVKTK